MKTKLGDCGMGRRSKANFFFLVVVLMAMTANAFAQRATGAISGRVITEDGQPIPHAKVNIIGIGVGGGVQKILAGRVEIITDAGGNFVADKLDPAPYSITASAPGYVLAPNEKVASSKSYAHIGDSVTIRMIRGGVITGRVLNTAGEPVIGISIEPTRVRDEQGRPVTGQLEGSHLFGRQTDDRGIYRVYGLAPGSYVVSVGPSALGFSFKPTPFAGRAKIYYPSATRDTAVEVTVRSGDEANGIDIRYRAESGLAITGKVLGAPTGGQGMAAMMPSVVTLTKAGTDLVIDTSAAMPIGDNTGYSFYGLPNGEYEVTATRPSLDDSGTMLSAPRRVTLNGRDVTGIDLKLEATASISGVVALEKLAVPATGQKCESARESFLDEITFRARPSDPAQKTPGSASVFGDSSVAVPDDKGAFAVKGLKAGRHFLESQLPDDHWFVKSVLWPTAPAGNPAAREAGRNGVTVKAGEKLSGLAVTLAEGAAGLKGKVTTTGKLPSRLRIHLLPAEVEAKDDVLRFAETIADEDGSFVFANIAPGKYLLITRTIPEVEPTDKPAKPAAWDVTERTKLRKEAEVANAIVELKTCQRVTDFSLRWAK